MKSGKISTLVSTRRTAKTKSIYELTEAEYNNALYRFNKSYSINENNCWIWTSYTFRNTNPKKPCLHKQVYGQFSIRDLGRRSIRAHCVSWILHNGDIPDGLLVLHNCDTPLCVNPKHLRLGTHKENMADMRNRGRAATGLSNTAYLYPEKRPKGEKHGMAKLTEEKVKLIKRDCCTSMTGLEIANKYQINNGTVSFIRRGLQWRHVEI